jgi:apolipoprotein N-acyltransferase
MVIVDHRVRYVSFALTSAILGILSFPPFGLSFCAWAAFIPLMIMAGEARAKDAALYSYLSGVLFYIGTCWWLLRVTVPGAVLLILFLSLFHGLFGYAANRIKKYSMDLLLLPFIWIVLEYLRSHIFGGFPWAILGYTQYKNIPMIQVADLTGVYGVSFLIMIFNTSVYSFFIGEKRRTLYLAITLFIMVFVLGYGIMRVESLKPWCKIRPGVVQGNIPQADKFDPASSGWIFDKHSSLTRGLAAERPDMVIWPETSYPYLVSGDEGLEDVSVLAVETGIPLLAGIVRNDREGHYFNSAFLVGKDGAVKDIYDKTHLVPFGEYIPFEKIIFFIRGLIDKPIGNFLPGEKYTLFTLNSVTLSRTEDQGRKRETRFLKFGVMICFEDCFGYISREFVKGGASFLVNITNDAWFGPSGAQEQHLQASVFRAVENHVPVIRAANTGVSCFIDSTGKVLSRVREGGEETFVEGCSSESVDITNVRTFYTFYGDIFIFFSIFILALITAVEVYIIKKESPVML